MLDGNRRQFGLDDGAVFFHLHLALLGGGHLQAAAQLLFGVDPNAKNLHSLPGRDDFLVGYLGRELVHLVDGDGDLLASVDTGNSLTYLKGQANGSVWGFRPHTGNEDAYIALIDTEPLALTRDAHLNLFFTDLAAAAGDSLILIPSTGGAPLLLDAITFTELGNLDLLPDLSDSCLVLADPSSRLVYFVESGGARRLLRVDLDDGPGIDEVATLNGTATQLQMGTEGHLLIALHDTDLLVRYDSMDFTIVSELSVDLVLLAGRFTPSGDDYWQQKGSSSIGGFSLDWDGGIVTEIAQYDQLATIRQVTPLSIGGRIATSISNGWISLCDPSRDGP